jgi:hypothetical protein
MSLIDDLLKQSGLKYEELKVPEKEQLNVWVNEIQKSQLSVEKIRVYISSMREAVEKELTKHDLDSKQDLFLKARLRNYILLEAFLSTPQKAKEQVENLITSMIKK